MNKFWQDFNAFFHLDKYYTAFIVHAPLAAALVLWKRNWYMFAFAATIGVWKNWILDMKSEPNTTFFDQSLAVFFYIFGALVGAWGAGMFR